MRGFFFFFVIIIALVIRVSKEFSKVNKGRPSTGVPPVPSEGERGARDISDFLQELKRLNQPLAQREAERSAYDEQTEMREKIREAAQKSREMKAKLAVEPFPLVVTPTMPKPAVLQQEHDAYSVVNTAVQAEREAEQKRVGLEHPVFAGSLYDPMSIAKRAIVLQEVMGKPLGLRE